MPERTRSQFAADAIDAYQRQVDRGISAREACRHVVADLTSRVGRAFRIEAEQLADRAIKSYAGKSIDHSPVDAKAAAVREVTRPAEAGLDVKNYSRTVIDSYRCNQGKGAAAVLAHSAAAADAGRAELHDAACVADKALKTYSQMRRKGMDHIAAREQTAQEMARRFDDRGRDTQMDCVMTVILPNRS
jgi:hypothetical protein